MEILEEEQIDFIKYTPPICAQIFSPVGPSRLTLIKAGNTQVVSVPSRYSMSYIIVNEKLCYIIDIGSVTDIPIIEKIISSFNLKVQGIIPTHFHFDHIMGIDKASIYFKAPILLSKVAKITIEEKKKFRAPKYYGMPTFWITWIWQGMPFISLQDMKDGFKFGFPWSLNQFKGKIGKILEDGDSLPQADDWKVIMTPGHSDESLCLYNENEGFLISGDTIRNFQGGEYNPIVTSTKDYEITKRKISKLNIRVIFPGHGPICKGFPYIREIKTPKIV